VTAKQLLMNNMRSSMQWRKLSSTGNPRRREEIAKIVRERRSRAFLRRKRAPCCDRGGRRRKETVVEGKRCSRAGETGRWRERQDVWLTSKRCLDLRERVLIMGVTEHYARFLL